MNICDPDTLFISGKAAKRSRNVLREALFPQNQENQPLDPSEIRKLEAEARKTLAEWPGSRSAQDANNILRLVSTLKTVSRHKEKRKEVRRKL